MAAPKNVYELAQERLDVIFREFDTICVSFSGGKDSGVLLNLCIDYIRRNRLNRKLCVFHMDYEIQYSMTIDYVDRVLEANKDILEVTNFQCSQGTGTPVRQGNRQQSAEQQEHRAQSIMGRGPQPL